MIGTRFFPSSNNAIEFLKDKLNVHRIREIHVKVCILRNYFPLQVGGHDRLGMQLVPLKVLTPYETKELTLDLLKNMNINDHQNKKSRGQLVVELKFTPFREESSKFSSQLDGCQSTVNHNDRDVHDDFVGGAGLLSVKIQGATSVEGKRHSNPYAVMHYRGEKKKTKVNLFNQLIRRLTLAFHMPAIVIGS